MAEILFSPGRIVVTPGCLKVLETSGVSALTLLLRHASGDWGDCDDEDRQANDSALKNGDRIFSVYNLSESDDTRIWIITEADRSSTCLLLPSEY